MLRKLSKREKYSISAAAALIYLFIMFQFIVFPFMEKREQLSRNLLVKTKILQDMLILKSEYEVINKKVNLSKVRFKSREKGFTLFSFLDRLAGKAGVKDHITYMKPSSSARKDSQYKVSLVEMKLQAVIFQQLVTYLLMVETSKNVVSVKRISISKTKKQEAAFDAVLQVETIEI